MATVSGKHAVTPSGRIVEMVDKEYQELQDAQNAIFMAGLADDLKWLAWNHGWHVANYIFRRVENADADLKRAEQHAENIKSKYGLQGVVWK